MSDLQLGPCQVLFGTDGAEADLGKTEGGVVVHFATDVADLKSDQFGTAPEDQSIVGQTCKIDVPLAEITLDNLALALNQTKTASGGKHGIAGANIVGTLLSTKAQSLLLKRYVGGVPSTNTEDWFKCKKAAPSGNFDLGYNKSAQKIVMVIFTAYPDASGNLYLMGDETAAESGS